MATDLYAAYEICLRAAEISGGIVFPPVPFAPAAKLSRAELRSGEKELFPPSLWASRELCREVYIELMESMADISSSGVNRLSCSIHEGYSISRLAGIEITDDVYDITIETGGAAGCPIARRCAMLYAFNQALGLASLNAWFKIWACSLGQRVAFKRAFIRLTAVITISRRGSWENSLRNKRLLSAGIRSRIA